MHNAATKRISGDRPRKPVDMVLCEAWAMLRAARKHAAELSEIGITDNELCHVRKLVAKVAAHHRTLRDDRSNIITEFHELQLAKEVILRAVELKFGNASELFKEFCGPEGIDAYVYSHSAS